MIGLRYDLDDFFVDFRSKSDDKVFIIWRFVFKIQRMKSEWSCVKVNSFFTRGVEVMVVFFQKLVNRLGL